MGRRERERLRTLPTAQPVTEQHKLRSYNNEIARERGVILLAERGGMWFAC
jgi:hypothetical protein